ncbi:MAG TPA: glycosyltransferase family 4 protein [Bryobacteraceae bacterium]|nr:glycosyltransferase family 4 protein [Bryobacteraceae bacterium]
MRILIASTHRSLVGGVEKYLQSILPALLERGHHIGLLHEYPCDRTKEQIDASAAGLPAWCVAESGLTETLHVLASWRPDVVYLQGLESLPLEQALLDRYPTVFYAHNYYGSCVSGSKCHMSWKPQPCTRKMGLGCLLQYYPRRCGGLHPGKMLKLFQIQSARQSRIPRFRAILVASQHMLREFGRHGVRPDQLHLVPLPAAKCDAGRAPGPKLPGQRIVMAGRLTDLKGGRFLIHALPRASKQLGRNLELIVVGDGPERARLQNLAARLGVEAEFTGWLDRDQTSDRMREADLVAVPSVWPEPFGLVGVEAGCLGTPAVGYAVGGIPDWLIPGVSGELAPGDPPTVQGLADAIVRALADPEHYKRLCQGAWKNARRFGLENHLAQLDTILGLCGSPAALEAANRSASDVQLKPL